MNNNQKLGKFGEDKACDFLIKKNYKILERNFSCKQGEIDIIALSPQKEIVFVEVKTRRNLKYGLPCEAVDFNKKNHIYSASKFYIYSNKIKNVIIRYDVIEVYVINLQYIVRHIKEAF